MARIIVNGLKSAICSLFLSAAFFSCAGLEENLSGNMIPDESATRATGSDITPYFYYYGGEKQYLELDTERVFISMSDEAKVKDFVLSTSKTRSMKIDPPKKSSDRSFWTTIALDGKLSNEAYLAKLAEIKASGKDVIVAPYFKNGQQENIGLSNFFYVKLKNANDRTLLEQEAAKVNAIIDHQNEFMPLWYVLSVTETSEFNAMELANRFYESGLFQYAEPDLLEEMKLHAVNDPYYGQQWGLKNTGSGINAEQAWQISTGSGVVVAVVDTGVQMGHPDLSANIYHKSFDSEYGTLANPISQIALYGEHGTNVAGIIGASQNNRINGSYEGITGVAPDCKLMSVANFILSTTTSAEKRANGINWAWRNGADVLNCSWGSSQLQVMDDAINAAATQGRGGKGCVLVFAAGNDGSSTVSYPARLPNVIAVGAINNTGTRRSDSNYGTALDVVAPGSGIYTTTWNSGYDNNFMRTSSAAPHVSGIAALILSVYPNLTRSDVIRAIETTADRYPYMRDNYYGYGLVNAYKALMSPLVISGGTDTPQLNTNYTYTVPATQTGITFMGWTVPSSGGGYTVTGGTSGTSLTIKFTSLGNYTIRANFRMPNGTYHYVYKELNLPISGLNTPYIYESSNNTVMVNQPQAGVVFDWEQDGNISRMGAGPEFQVEFYYGQPPVVIRCRARIGGNVSNWSPPLTVFN